MRGKQIPVIMAKIDQGILGGYSGRIGNVVGYYRMGKWCVRAYQPTINDAKTEAQLQQRSVFKAMIQFASRNLEPMRLGLRQVAREEVLTECNYFIRYNCKHFRHAGGAVEVDYAALQFSKGSLPCVEFTGLNVEGGVRVEVDYEPNRSSSRAKMEDSVYVYAYLPALGAGILSAAATRKAKRLAFVLPDEWAGQEVHFYGFTLAADGTASATAYLGTSLAPMTEEPENMSNTKNNIIEKKNGKRKVDTVSGAYRGGGDGGVAAGGEP